MTTRTFRFRANSLVAFAASLLAGLALSLAPSVARADSDAYYRDLATKVEIRRDEWGVPHVVAPTEEGAALAMGYVQGEDYPDLLPELFTAATAESAKYFGSKYAQRDLQVLRYRFFEDSVERFGTLRPDIQAVLNAFAAGYNWALAKQDPAVLAAQPWKRPITGAHVLAYGRALIILEFVFRINQVANMSEGGAGGAESASADSVAPWYGAGGDRDRGEESLPGSNMWAIGRARSASGKGILLANPHLEWSGPQTFYEAHVIVPGVVNLSGCTLLGSPGITIGFNEFLGWSHTVNLFDSHDLFSLTPDPADPKRYLYDGLSLPLEERTFEIEVKNAKGELEKRTDTTLFCHFGPVLRVKDGVNYALKMPNDREIGIVEGWHRLGRSRNLAEFQSALDQMSLPMFNVAVADRQGNCYYLFNGRIPERATGVDWTKPQVASSALEWTFVHPRADLPSLENPPNGYVQNCNDAPWYTNARTLIDKHRFPSYVSKDVMGLRTQLSLKMLEEDDSITLEEVKAYKFNTLCLGAAWFKNDLIAALEPAAAGDPKIGEAIAILRAWNDRADIDARGAMLFEHWLKNYVGKAKPKWAKEFDPADPIGTPRGLGDPDAAVAAMKTAIEKMMATCGRLDPAYGDVNRLIRGDKSFPLAGGLGQWGYFRVLALQDVPKEEAKTPGERRATAGDTYCLAVEFTDPPTAYSVVAYGQTERADSPHHTDQSEMFSKHQWKRAWFTLEDVKANTARLYRPGE